MLFRIGRQLQTARTKRCSAWQTGRSACRRETGSLWGDPFYETIDVDGDGVGDLLKVMCWVNLGGRGDFVLAGDLVNAAGTQPVREDPRSLRGWERTDGRDSHFRPI